MNNNSTQASKNIHAVDPGIWCGASPELGDAVCGCGSGGLSMVEIGSVSAEDLGAASSVTSAFSKLIRVRILLAILTAALSPESHAPNVYGEQKDGTHREATDIRKVPSGSQMKAIPANERLTVAHPFREVPSPAK